MEEYLKSLYEEIEKLFADEKSGHDVSHLLRVVDNARRIQEKEGGDKKVVLISALVHDVHRLMSNECGHFIFPRESLDKTKEIILQSGIN